MKKNPKFKGAIEGQIEFREGEAPELATQPENTLSWKKLRNDCNARITELFYLQLNPLNETLNWKYSKRKL